MQLTQNLKTKLTAAYGMQPWKLALIPNTAWQVGAYGQEGGGVEWTGNY